MMCTEKQVLVKKCLQKRWKHGFSTDDLESKGQFVEYQDTDSPDSAVS